MTAPKAIDSDPRTSADKDITDIVKIDLTPTDDSSKLGGTFGLRPGPDDPALQLIAIYVRTITNDVVSTAIRKSSTVSASPEVNVGVSYSGADYNKPETWKAEGFGEDCWKIDWTTSQYLYPLPSPSVTSGRNLAGWTYTAVIVKAGSVTDPTLQMNTLFKNPAVGTGVFADVNANGISDPSGRTGDKEISHVVFCGKSGTDSSTTVGGQVASTTTAAASTTTGASSTVAPTTTGATTTTGAATTTTGASTTTAAPTTTRATTTSIAATTTTRATTGGNSRTSTTLVATTTTVPGSKDPIEVSMTTEPKVTLCHRTASKTNPYVSITVDASAVLKEGHGSHTGPLYPEDNWGDIIPAFGDYAGLNWPAGKAIYDAGCDASKVPATTVAPNAASSTTVGKDGKVTLCHRTASKTNPYVSITVDASAVLKEGHGSHTGPVFPADNWGDIIPPFEGYAGLNWPAGYDIWNNGCKPVTATTTTTGSATTVRPNQASTTTRPGATPTTRPNATTTVAGATTTRPGATPTTRPNATTTVAGATTTRPGATPTTRPNATTTTTIARATTTTTRANQTTVSPNLVTTTTTRPATTSTTIATTVTTVAGSPVTTVAGATTTPGSATTAPGTTGTTTPGSPTTTVAGGGTGVTTTTTALVEGMWNPESAPTTKPSAATLRKRAVCFDSSAYEASITQVQMLLSRGTSQEVVEFEVCMNNFSVTSSNTPLAAFGEDAISDPLVVEGQSVPAVGGGTSMLWPALSLIAIGGMLLLSSRRFES